MNLKEVKEYGITFLFVFFVREQLYVYVLMGYNKIFDSVLGDGLRLFLTLFTFVHSVEQYCSDI
jgi:hypothetical protein